ncbi:hypothetical protein [Lichenifustis flavocetrariae]|uniref:Uncharacterized protein n=1 Tax=Lichenifustis flavocetrariae TaxID=2949735 RepID=A0AA42CP78_9HYPH|nr:hypothetical protein [Lichenifustis flavocetrariae]MCW6510157.1 hypothetical protein [Lichenifustis flavocetrariae]
MRSVKIVVLGALAILTLAGPAMADGGLGFQPPPFLADILQPAPARPYTAVCVAPAAACEVDYMYPIKPGKACWCRSGLFVYSGGVTRPPVPVRPVYKY